ncbi:MAG: hypothetical protein N2443_05055 [Blastocatellia bacterium]|nr:hypothetical protein [Blastocatellia bacterium]MCX7752223.1 hypothetical protein [Blastocatellia bacterium]MDW8256314.1 hypothetical protein [Acidobacteriota bacterium]
MSKPPERSPRARLVKKGTASDGRPEDRARSPVHATEALFPEELPREQKKVAAGPREGRTPTASRSSSTSKRSLRRPAISGPDQWGILPDRPLFPSAQRTAKRQPFKRGEQKLPRRAASRKKRARPKAAPSLPKKLTPEQRRRVEERYRAMVASGERPPEGRRKTIARELGLPYALVSEVVKNYLHRERLRRTNFEIEKIYWREVLAGQDDARAIVERAAAELKLDPGRIWWWLEKLHEWRKTLDAEPEVSETQRAAILSFYQEYLKRETPPEKGLHLLISETLGNVTPRQVHKVLLQHRLSFWTRLKNNARPDGTRA